MPSKHSAAFKIEINAKQTEMENLDSNQNKVDVYVKPSRAPPKGGRHLGRLC